MKLLALLALLATPVAADDTDRCFQLGQIGERIAIARDGGFSMKSSMMAIPMDIPSDRYRFFIDMVDVIYGQWRYEAPVDIGTVIFTLCMRGDIR